MASEYSYTGSRQGYASYPQISNASQYFEYNPQTNQSICTICGTKMKASKLGSSFLELHIQKYHSNYISQFSSNEHDIQEFRPYGNDYANGGEENYGNYGNYENDGNQWQSQYSYQVGNSSYNFDYEGQDNAYNSMNYGQSYYEPQPSSYNYDLPYSQKQPSNFSSSRIIQIAEPIIEPKVEPKIEIKKKEKKIIQPQPQPQPQVYQYQHTQTQKPIVIVQDKNVKQTTKNNVTQQISTKMQAETIKPSVSLLDYSYPLHIDIKNRPLKFLQKIKKQGYFEDVYEPPTPLNPKQTRYSISVRQFFKNIDIGLNQQSTSLLGKNKLNLSQNELNDAIENLWWGRKQLPEISTLFRQRGIHFRQSPDKETILVCEKGSLHDYLRYGECISIISYSQLVSVQENVQFLNDAYCPVYDAIVIMCHDWRAEFTFLALGLFNSRNQKSVATLLQMFFGCMHGFVCNSIILSSMDLQPFQCIKDSVQTFCNLYGCKIKVFDNKIINKQKFGKQIDKLRQIEKSSQEMHKEICEQFSSFKAEIQQVLKSGKEQLNELKQTSQITDIHQLFDIRIESSNQVKHNLNQYDPKGISKQKNFAGINNQIRQIQGLRRKMNWIIKPSQQKPIKFSQFVSSVFRLNRYLKKISKQPSIDFRTYYKKYKHSIMYKLYRTLGIKVFDLLEANYFCALKLQVNFISPIEARIVQIEKSNVYFKSVSTFQLKFIMQNNRWVCNCGRLYQTGIPCRHLIAIILKFGGSLEFYINSRWFPIKGDKEKLKKFRQKQPNDKQ